MQKTNNCVMVPVCAGIMALAVGCAVTSVHQSVHAGEGGGAMGAGAMSTGALTGRRNAQMRAVLNELKALKPQPIEKLSRANSRDRRSTFRVNFPNRYNL